MLGNLTGWIIAAVISAMGAYGTLQLVRASAPTPPTDLTEQAMKPFVLSDSVNTVLPDRTSLKDDAGDLYQAAITDVTNHGDSYTAVANSKDYDEVQADADALKGLDDLIKARKCASMTLFTAHPEQLINFDPNPDWIAKLDQLVAAGSRAMLLAKSSQDYKAATNYAEALLALGFNLYHERLTWFELSEGEKCMGTACQELQSIFEAEKVPGKAEVIQKFDQQRKDEYQNLIDPIHNKISTLDPAGIAENAGDMLEMAVNPKVDRLWRIEAIYRVGRLQRNAEKTADQLKAPRVLQQITTDAHEDPAVKEAAKLVLNMSEKDYQSQR